jgi:hypothetical protein
MSAMSWQLEPTDQYLRDAKRYAKLEQTRLYTYADMESKVLHLLCMGSKTNQPKEIRYATSVVVSLRRNPNG